jgi:hypothetical protein
MIMAKETNIQIQSKFLNHIIKKRFKKASLHGNPLRKQWMSHLQLFESPSTTVFVQSDFASKNSHQPPLDLLQFHICPINFVANSWEIQDKYEEEGEKGKNILRSNHEW